LLLNRYSLKYHGGSVFGMVQSVEQRFVPSFSQEQGRSMVIFKKNLIITDGQKLIISG
jgi:hypothetical protein